MKRELKWVIGIIGILVFLYALPHILWFADKKHYEYEGWRYERLWSQLENAEDEESRYNLAILKACVFANGTTPMNGSHDIHCYDSVKKDQRRKWRPGIGGVKEPEWKEIWSKNVVYDDDFVYGTNLVLGCKNNIIGASWGVGYRRKMKSITDNLKIKNDNNPPFLVKLDEPEFLAFYPVKQSVFNEMANYLKNGRGILKLWIPQEDGTEHEFRFDMYKFPRELRKMQKYCPTMKHRTDDVWLSQE